MSAVRESQAFSTDDAVRLAHERYGIDAVAQRWPGEHDLNFGLEATDGRRFVLKVMDTTRDAAFVDMQCGALERVADAAPTAAVSRVIPTRQGQPFFELAGVGGSKRVVWLLRQVPGSVLAKVRPQPSEMLEDLGTLLGNVDAALETFSHASASRSAFRWDLRNALWIREHLDAIADPERRALVQGAIDLYGSSVMPHATELRQQVIHGDANDYNVLLDWRSDAARWSVGLIDFGDMHVGWTVAEPAVAAAYALLASENPLAAVAAVVRGFHAVHPLTETEVSVLFPLVRTRLAVSVVTSALGKRAKPDDSYVTISEAPAWNALARLRSVHPRFAEYVLRQACGYAPVPRASAVRSWLAAHREEFVPVVDADLRGGSVQVLDLGIGSALLGADPENSAGAGRAHRIATARAAAGAVAIGRYGEARWVPDAAQSIGREIAATGVATIHLGTDVFVASGSAVHAPLAGRVQAVTRAASASEAAVTLAHDAGDAGEFFTIFGHLAADTVAALAVGAAVVRGQAIGRVAESTPEERGAEHLHFQIATDLLDAPDAFPHLGSAAEREVWADLSPDSNLLLGVPEARFPRERSFAETRTRRARLLGPSLSVSYRKPLKMVRGWHQYLYDDAGRPYLDVFNNVPLVGHSHPRIVEAVARQLALLNTNTRYLHDTVLEYAERLTALLPPALHVCWFVNSGSEANELAIRLARTHTHAEDMIVLENAYHGNTGTVTDISPYKFDGPGGTGRKPWVHVAPVADDYRGKHRRGEANLGPRYAEDVKRILDGMQAEGRRVAAYIAESMPSVGGQIVFPDGYLADVYRYVRAAGGVCIADEVQVGFGRLGEAFWGFETQHVTPDIVVLAKPIGNCFPLAAVVTTEAVARSFNNGMEFFSTYGGNPVSTAAGLAVLDVVRDEELQANAREVGAHLLERLRGLQERHPIIGDVRGMGLFLGVDLVRDRATREPAPRTASYVVNRLRERGVLAGTDGPFHNVLKFRPPLNLAQSDADLFIDVLDSVLGETPVARGYTGGAVTMTQGGA